jgi:hypothetical protein
MERSRQLQESVWAVVAGFKGGGEEVRSGETKTRFAARGGSAAPAVLAWQR